MPVPDPAVSSLILKDVLTLVLSAAALVTAVSSAALSHNWQRRGRRDQLRKQYDEAVLGLVAVKAARGNLRQQLRDEAYSKLAARSRGAHNAQREFYLGRSLQILREPWFRPNEFELLIIGEALYEAGDLCRAAEIFTKAVALARTAPERVAAESSLGVIDYAQGNFAKGRECLRQAVNDYASLAVGGHHRADVMYARATLEQLKLLRQEAKHGIVQDRARDLARLDELAGHLRDRGHIGVYEDGRRRFEEDYGVAQQSIGADAEKVDAPTLPVRKVEPSRRRPAGKREPREG